MLKNFLFAIALLSFPFTAPCLEASQSENFHVETTIYNTTTTLYHDATLPTALLVMADGTAWEIVSPPMVRRAPDSEEPLFCFQLADWEKPMPIAIDHIQWILDQDLAGEQEDAVYNFLKTHEDIVTEFPYVIENRDTGKYTFARPATKESMIAFFAQYGKNRYQQGLEEGVAQGYREICETAAGKVLHEL